ncbi:diaminopimelate decarboxylase [Kallotenue papyrolyticum]|uniref:diaminopimelate decarboxylase n=1 Tax=Kallotenue papyrolyticum TaxID=1325125 RepID=UPI000492754A|nr:diaminopimelate decarboxylase [Kallotenue papyrolyticum]
MQTLDPLLWPDSARWGPAGLEIGGCAVTTLARAYGTPLYVLDQATLAASAERFRAALQRVYPGASSVHYAGKALLNVPLARLIAAAGLGLDCVSLGEVAVARRADLDPAQIHLHGNAKPRAELEQALAWGIGRIVVDSLDELRLLHELTRDRATPQPILLRLNPGVAVQTHAHIQTGQLDSKFGLPIATGMAWEAAALALASPGLRLVGLHAHLGSQLADLTPFGAAIVRLAEFAAELRARYGWTMAELSPGGGLAVPYRSGDPAPTIDDYAAALATAVMAQCQRHGLPLPRLVIEPGRALIARAVVALYQVVAVKRIAGVRTFVAVDGGMGDNIRPALYDARYTALRADQPGGTPARSHAAAGQELVTIVGRYCESGDVLLRDITLPPLEAGALIAVPMAGAYTLSMASTYNLVPRPPLIAVGEGMATVLQRRETYEDLMARDSV